MTESAITPTIVIAAWNRPHSLQRLLQCLLAGHYAGPTRLHISIDYFQYDEVAQLARAFDWPFGEKIVEQHPARLGLRKHILYCGGLTAQYGSIILLEDDLAVSPWAYDYAQQALAFAASDPQIAGISLYNYTVAESCLQPFEPWQDGWDNWYLQLPSSWGAAFTAAQWQGFTDWLAAHFQNLPELPSFLQQWTAQSWKKLFAAYLLHQHKFFLYPRFALSTNFEDAGVHSNTQGLFQVPLLMGQRPWRFGSLQDSLAVYDSHYEMQPALLKRICPQLAPYDFVVDLLGQKSSHFLDRPLVLTRRKGGEALLSYGDAAIPRELNLHLQSPGAQLRLVAAHTQFEADDPLWLQFRSYSGTAMAAVLHAPDHRLPSFSIIVPYAAVEYGEGRSLSYLLDHDYPGLEILLIVPPDKMQAAVWEARKKGAIRVVESAGTEMESIQQAVALSAGQVLMVWSPGTCLDLHKLRQVAEIFRQYPGLDWLSCLPLEDADELLSKRLARYRWDSERISSANAQQIQRYLISSLQFIKRSLWIKAGQDAQDLSAHFQRMGQICLPQISELSLEAVMPVFGETISSVWGDSALNRSRKHYHLHRPLLWKWHRRKSDYKPVLRYDATHATWYEFDY